MTGVSEPEIVAVPSSRLGEGPRWDERTGTLLWVDIPQGLVRRLDPADGTHAAIGVGQPVGVAVPRAAGGLALAVRDGFALLDEPAWDRPATDDPEMVDGLAVVDGLEVVAPVTAAERPGNRMNDGACDRAGRFFAGTKAEDDTPGAGALYRLGPDHRAERVLDGVGISNGIAWSPDERLCYYVDTLTNRVDVFDYDPADGRLAGRRTFAEITRGKPDGITVDARGHVWVALWDGGAVLRLRPDGRLDLAVEIPVRNVTSCAFGGPGLTDLYVTTAWDGAAGGELLRCRTSVEGLPANPYRDAS
ncbi:SMP-30/gluconolactonase/LRE family protein [Nonomuraea rhodomycinica]|uniref:SMP-30/gluconolactonase/LRE family protein n=1 Tax=Nonomuraea rhodomycinica TaxID=1712872 RepID=A0A7Y6IKC7_9ACTN|nr:SMP-30/gluconolactonase/LRE family protein [Nonomuraea rhodomycinica]NUW39810.1 SMP-30/gluconolactonase/LRE family protein [Nonomuraea rhodomycinica]